MEQVILYLSKYVSGCFKKRNANLSGIIIFILFYQCQKFLPSESYIQLRIRYIKEAVILDSVWIFFPLNLNHFNLMIVHLIFLPYMEENESLEYWMMTFHSGRKIILLLGTALSIVAYTCIYIHVPMYIYIYV